MPRASRSLPAVHAPRQRVQPSQARALKKIDAILDAAADLLQRLGPEAASTTAIAAQAGIPPATVYHYFDNRLAVFAALARRIMDRVDARLVEVLHDELQAPRPDIDRIVRGLHEAYAQAPGYAAVAVMLRAEPAFHALVDESNERVASVIASLLVQRRRMTPARAQRVAWILSATTQTVIEAALAAPPARSRALLAELGGIMDCLFVHYAADEDRGGATARAPRGRRSGA